MLMTHLMFRLYLCQVENVTFAQASGIWNGTLTTVRPGLDGGIEFLW